MDNLIDLFNQIADAQCTLDELNECGTLEDRLKASEKLSELEERHLKASMAETGGL